MIIVKRHDVLIRRNASFGSKKIRFECMQKSYKNFALFLMCTINDIINPSLSIYIV